MSQKLESLGAALESSAELKRTEPTNLRFIEAAAVTTCNNWRDQITVKVAPWTGRAARREERLWRTSRRIPKNRASKVSKPLLSMIQDLALDRRFCSNWLKACKKATSATINTRHCYIPVVILHRLNLNTTGSPHRRMGRAKTLNPVLNVLDKVLMSDLVWIHQLSIDSSFYWIECWLPQCMSCPVWRIYFFGLTWQLLIYLIECRSGLQDQST